jgi:outer membrane protein TolC
VPETDLPRIGGEKATSSTNWTPYASTLAALTVDQEVYDFGRIAAQAAVGDALAQVAKASADNVDLDVQLGVEEAFHAVLAAKQVQRATEEAFKRASTHRDYAQAATRSGMRPPIELTRAQADVALLEVRRVRAATGLEATQAALAAAIGSDQLEVDAREPPAGETLNPAFDEALRRAQSANPAIAAAIAHLRAQEQLSRAVLRELAPNLFASATLSGRAGGSLPSSGMTSDVPYGDGWLPDVGNWHLGLVLQWNIFDMTVLRRREAAKAREDAARADLQLVRTNVTLAAQRSWLDLDASTRAMPGLDQSLRAAQANQAQADARFRAGLGTSVELADAEALLTNAELEVALGRFAVARARAALGRAIGEKVK